MAVTVSPRASVKFPPVWKLCLAWTQTHRFDCKSRWFIFTCEWERERRSWPWHISYGADVSINARTGWKFKGCFLLFSPLKTLFYTIKLQLAEVFQWITSFFFFFFPCLISRLWRDKRIVLYQSPSITCKVHLDRVWRSIFHWQLQSHRHNKIILWLVLQGCI